MKRLQLLGNAVVAGGLILIISFLPAPHRWILAIQVISFSGLGLFVVSIYQNRERRF